MSNPCLIAYTSHNKIEVPNERFTELKEGFVLVPMRGIGRQLAVFSDKVCVGYVDVSDLGCTSVVEWMQKTNWKDQGL